jgi:hypothetical protein
MSDIPSRPDEFVSTALQELARSSPQSASLESRTRLARAFRRHRARRRAVRLTAMFALILATGSGCLWLAGAFNAFSSGRLDTSSANRPRPSAGRRSSSQADAANQVVAGGEAFLALPSFAFETPGEELRVIRVEMSVSSLRVLGARVNDELSTRRIVADLLVGTDGTPYAFRIIT